MHRSSETIAALAASLAKAQTELTNPEKSLVATVRADRQPEKTFRYASLSNGLDIIRKTLGSHEIAALQTTAVDPVAGLINLTTVLAHASGEWIASDWPVCPLTDMATPHRMGAALTYARRYALFTLVGIAGEDDTDAPDLNAPTSQDAGRDAPAPFNTGAQTNGLHKPVVKQNPGRRRSRPIVSSYPAILAPAASAALRDQLLAELENVASSDDAAMCARRMLTPKNSLTADDARVVEDAFKSKLVAVTEREQDRAQAPPALSPSRGDSVRAPVPRRAVSKGIDKSVLAFPEPRRVRDKTHLRHVAKQPCLICGRRPSDAHHIRCAQPRALGRKVSDEFTVPLCRGHHRQVHQHGNEAAWWANVGIDGLAAAHKLWAERRPAIMQTSDANDGNVTSMKASDNALQKQSTAKDGI